MLKQYLRSGAPSSSKSTTLGSLAGIFEQVRLNLLGASNSQSAEELFAEDRFLNFQKSQVMDLAKQCFLQVSIIESQTLFAMEGETLRELGWLSAKTDGKLRTKKALVLHKDNWQSELEGLPGLESATFVWKNLCAQVDFLFVMPDGKFVVLMVSASPRIKESLIQEADFARYVLENSGMEVAQVWLLHPNESYTRPSGQGQIDNGQFFSLSPLGQKLKHLSTSVSSQLPTIFAKALEAEPCDSKQECLFCTSQAKAVSPDSVHTLHRPGQLIELLEQEGVHTLAETQTASLKTRSQLKERHLIQIRAHLQQEVIVDKVALAAFLGSLSSPYSFLDFESTCEAVPPLDLARVWEHLPFLFSTHQLLGHTLQSIASCTNVFDLDDDLLHHSYLIDPGADRQQGERCLIEALLKELPAQGSILAYGAAFERNVLHRLAQRHPDLKHQITHVAGRIVDLQIPFANFWFYHPGQMGRLSLKKILPLIGGRNHSALAIRSGGDANQRYYELCHPALGGIKSRAEQDQISRDLTLYCTMDTQGLVTVLHTLISQL